MRTLLTFTYTYYLFFYLRPNSPALNGNFFVFHSNSMKLGEVLVHINNYNFSNFHWIKYEKQKFFNDTFNGIRHKYKMFFSWLGFKQLCVYLSTMKKKITKSISELMKQKMTLTLDMFMYYTSVCLVVALSFLMYFWSKKKLRSKKLTEKILTILACILSMVLHNYSLD